uniref:hypothetical protein n=1 Tax=Bacillus amyloliquefaciens TaxID=1390 RepID=UPI00333FF305
MAQTLVRLTDPCFSPSKSYPCRKLRLSLISFLSQSSGRSVFKYSSIKPAFALSSVCSSWASLAASSNSPVR